MAAASSAHRAPLRRHLKVVQLTTRLRGTLAFCRALEAAVAVRLD
jgi:hypothetical protein